MKTFLKILTPLALALPLLAKDATNAPANPATPAATPSTPGAVTPPARTLPRPITATPAAPGGAAAPAAAPAPATPAPATQAPATQRTIPAPQAPANTNAATTKPPTNAPGTAVRPTVPGTPAANQATPVVPGITPPGGAGAARPGVAGAPAPGAAGAAGAAGANQPAAARNPGDEIFPAGLIKFQDADLSQVLEIYQELTGRTILKPASLPQVKISIRTQTELTRAEAIQALDSILSLNGITMVPQGDPVTGKFIKALAEPQAGTSGAQISDLPHELLPESGTYVTHVVQLTNASPNDIIQVLQPFAKAPNSILTIPSTGMLVLRDYAENVKRMLEMVAKVDVVPQQEFESVVIPIKYALAGDIATVLGNLTAGGGSATTIGGQGTGGRGLSGGLGGVGGVGGLGGRGGLGGIGGQGIPGQPGYNPNQLNQGGLGGVGGVGGAGGRSSFQNRLQQIVNRAATGSASGDIFVLGQTKIIADERINALLVFASKADLHTISNIIEKLDVVLAQVLIEAIVLEVSLGNDLNYGFSYLQRNPTSGGELEAGMGAIRNIPFLNPDQFSGIASNAAGSLPSGFSYFARFMNFDAAVVAAATDSRINIITRPRVQTSHAVEAQIFVGQTRPYVTGSYSYFGGGPQTQFQQQQIGITLSVLPLINAEGLVVMDIATKIQQIGEDVPIDANFSVPETIDRDVTAKVAVRDRETIMLGGFIASQKTKSRSGVPILKDIPYVGFLFSAVKDSDQRKELIILLRPTVLPTPLDAATFTAEERARLPGTRRADKEFIESERKLLDEENRRSAKEARKLYKKEGFSE